MSKLKLIRNSLNLIIVIGLFSCKKSSDEIYIPPIISNEAIVNKFLQEPKNISPEVKAIINDLKKRESQQPFIADYAKKNGFPNWEYAEGMNSNVKTPDDAGNIKMNSTTKNDSITNNASITLIPLIDTLSKEVKSYIFCTKVHDSIFAYNTYNKNSVLEQRAPTLKEKAQYKTTLSINAFFEKKINKKSISNYNGIAGEFKFNNIDVKIRNVNPFSQKINSSIVSKEQITSTSISSKVIPKSCYVFLGVVEITNANGEVEYFAIYRQTDCPTLPEVIVYSSVRNSNNNGGFNGGGFNGPLPSGGTPLFNGWDFSGGGSGSNFGGGGTPSNGTFDPSGQGPFFVDPNMPLWGPPINYLNILEEYPDLNIVANQDNYFELVEFAQVYKDLQNSYSQRTNDPYAGMSQQDFLEMLRSNPSLVPTIDPVTILAKVGAGVAADILMQVMFIKIMDDDVNTWSEAFGKIQWGQVGLTGLTSLIGWNSATGKVLKALLNGAGAALIDLHSNSFQSWEITGRHFVEGFFGSLVGDALVEVAAKFGGVTNFLKRVVNRLDEHFSYATILRWLGGSLGIVNPLRNAHYGVTKSFIDHNGVLVNFTINNVRKVIGWSNDPNKVVLIGRNMDVIKKMKADYHPNAMIFDGDDWISEDATKQWRQWKSKYTDGKIPYDEVKKTIFYQDNEKFIRKMKAEGYTFIDLGNPLGTTEPSAFYDMEINLIFGN